LAAEEHPTYLNPSIVEALCEIQFTVSERATLQDYAGKFFEAIKDDFPTVEPVAEVGVQVHVTPSALEHRIGTQRQRLRFKHRDQPMYLQLGPGVLTLNVLPRYPGWEVVKREILTAWERAYAALGPLTAISRIGLRYINRVPLAADQRPGEWLRATDFIAAAVLTSDEGFFSRTQVTREGWTIVTVGDTEDSASGRALFLDIDRSLAMFSMAATPKPNLRPIEVTADRLHRDVWRIFEAAASDRFVALLKEGQ